MEIVAVDPFDDEGTAGWHAAYYAADTDGRPWAVPWTLEEVRADMQAEQKGRWAQLYALIDGGEVVCAGLVEIPLLDNLKSAWIQIGTPPQHGRRGYATRLLAHQEEQARAHGRSIFGSETAWPYDSDGTGLAGAEFCRKHGYALGQVSVQRLLDLTAGPERYAALAAEAAPHHAAYSLRSWAGDAPDELVASLAALAATITTEAPAGELELEELTADVDVFREQEAALRAQGRTRYTTVALDGAGEVVAYSDLIAPIHDPGVAYQWGTMVAPAHRGHRLGLAVKATNLVALMAGDTSRTRVVTYNAESNGPMVAVNELLGFVPVEKLGELQKKV